MKLNSHNVILPFVIPKGVDHNGYVKLWWEDRTSWLASNGVGKWNVYRIDLAFTNIVNSEEPPMGNNNIHDCVIFSFTDQETACLFKLTWG